MSDADDRELDQWIRSIVDAAGSDAPSAEAVPAVAASGRRRWPGIAAAAAVLLVAATVGAVVVLRDGDERGRVVPGTPPEQSSPADTDLAAGPTPTEPAPTDPAAAPLTTTPPTTISPATAGPTTVPEPALTRPVIDLDGCVGTWARTGEATPYDGMIYTVRSSRPVAFQLITTASGSLADEFAVVARQFADQRLGDTGGNTEVNGQPGSVQFNGERWGDLRWRLPDGSEAYLRTSTMTQDELLQLAAALVPRPSDATVPGFDLPEGPLVVADEATTPIVFGPITESACEFDGGGWMRASLVEGSRVAQAIFLTDRPKDNAGAVTDLGDGRVLTVSGRADVDPRSAEALATVRQATDAEWAELTGRDPADFPPQNDLVPPSDGSG